MIIKTVSDEKIDSSKLQTAGKDYAEEMLAAIAANPNAITGKARQRIIDELAATLNRNKDASHKLGDSRNALAEIYRTLTGIDADEIDDDPTYNK